MAFVDDVVDYITGQITTIGLSTSAAAGDEITGGGYAALVPDYEASAGGVADITAALEFSGTPGTVVTHAVFKRAGGPWFTKALGGSAGNRTFNSDGRLNQTTAEITHTLT